MPAPTATDANFERTFADLAFARMRDKAPSLLDYLIGFQLIDKNEDETHAVGVFGFKVGKEWVYAPVFFINGELKGHEMMYVKSQDAFVPMMEQWVNYVLNRRPRVLGEAEETPRGNLGIRSPDFDIFARAPFMGSKRASAPRSYSEICAHIGKTNADFLPFMDVFTVSPKHEKFACVKFDLPKAIQALGKQAKINLLQSMRSDTDFAESILAFYDLNDLNVKCADTDGVIDKQRAGSKTTMPDVTVITMHDQETALKQDLDEEQKKKLLKDRYVTIDNRPDEKKTKLYKVQLAQTLVGPDKPGFCDVVLGSGENKKLLVLTSPKQLGRSRPPFAVVIDQEGKRFANYATSDILTIKAYPNKDFESFQSGLSEGKNLKPGDYGVLISPTGASTSVFKVTNKENLTDGHTELTIWEQSHCSAGSLKDKGNHRYSTTSTDPVRKLVFTDKEGTSLRQIGETLFVPKEYKSYVIKSRPKEKNNYPSCVGDGCSELLLGSPTDMLNSIQKSACDEGAVRLDLRTDGIRFTPCLNGKPVGNLSKLAAIKYLVMNQGLDGADAEMLLKEAHPRKLSSHIIKYAWGEAPMSATFNEPTYGNEDWSRAQIQYPHSERQNLGQNDSAGARDAMRNDRYLDQDSKQQAQVASRMGQKEVLDTSVITGLVRTMDTSSVIDGYIGDMLLGLDRIGRVLFMYYWHNEKFKERYGQQDMAELEDNLRNVFKNLGELTLFLKQKTVEPDNAQTSEAKLTDVMG